MNGVPANWIRESLTAVGLEPAQIAETVDANAKLDLLMQVCFLFEEILDDTEKAIRAYQDVLELSPEYADLARSRVNHNKEIHP